jgi:alpha-mannosidase
MKPVKQKGQDYIGFDLRLEAVLEGIIYNPRNRKGMQKNYKNGTYLRRFNFLSRFTRKKYGTLRDFKMYFTGVSHLDAAWLFPVVDTKERAYKTFYKAMEHCDEFPFLTFSQTTPQYYDWIRGYDPKMWQKLKEYVKKKRIELTGGMWIEPDLDMPSGEALVRQRMYGQLYFLREFGFYPTMESLLDVFGFPWSLPQILVKSGATSFWTTKAMTGGWPFYAYNWRGIDGTEIFTYQFTYNWDSLSNNKRFREMARFPDPKHNQSVVDSHTPKKDIEELFSKKKGDYIRDFPLFYGIGDGGKGPLEIEIMFADTLAQMQNGKHVSQHEYVEILKKTVGERYFIWNDEMYLQKHRGTKTTQLEVKHYNRRAECWVNAAETLITILNLYNMNVGTYNKSLIFKMWQKILFNQFHDILPGSSIPDVYILAIKEQKEAIKIAQDLIQDSLHQISNKQSEDNINSNHKSVLIYNCFNWNRSEYLSWKNELFYFENIPPLSISNISLIKSKTNPEEFNLISEKEDVFVLENKQLRVQIHKLQGTILSIIYKKSKNEELELIETKGSYRNLGSGLRVFHEDPGYWKAWDLDVRYPQKKIKVQVKNPPTISQSNTGENVIKVDYEFLSSSATVTYYIRPKTCRLNLDIHTDVKDPQLLVKYFIPFALKSDEVTAEIPYASIARKRIKTTQREKAKWEMNMQKWLDISDENVGMMIVNDNTYAFSATAKGIYLTLTRTPEYPGISPLYGSTRLIPPKLRPKYTDLKPFDYKFSLIPHSGSWKNNHLWQEGYNFNQPLICSTPTDEKQKTAAKNKIDYSILNKFCTLNKSNVLIGTIKPSEWNGNAFDELKINKDWKWDSKSFILRLVELEGISTDLSINFNPLLKIKEISEVNLLEMDSKGISSTNSQKINIKLTPFEIITLRIIVR